MKLEKKELLLINRLNTLQLNKVNFSLKYDFQFNNNEKRKGGGITYHRAANSPHVRIQAEFIHSLLINENITCMYISI